MAQPWRRPTLTAVYCPAGGMALSKLPSLWPQQASVASTLVPQLKPPPALTVSKLRVAGAVGAASAPSAGNPLVACTVNVYETPLARPGTVIGLDAPLAVAPPGVAVTV